ncbi:DUF2171 domain-containing protein [Sphingomonas sp.]|uniref:DUF2171 domain-containing protein n=1 Tax=Sphingomonas sp. TaxID=28214 RepID=UPI003CC59432
MAYERYPRADGPRGYTDRNDLSDYGQDYSSTGDGYRSGARDYLAAGEQGGGQSYANRDADSQRDHGNRGFGRDEWRGQGSSGQQGRNQGYQRQEFGGGGDDHRGDAGRDDNRGREEPRQGRDTYRQQRGTYGRQPQSAERDREDDRGFMARAGDEVRSWFGNEDAERRREQDAQHDERGGQSRDQHYHSWRNQQIASFDRDYDEYRQENQSKFHNEFASWRTERQGQRDLLGHVEEHADVVGSDGEHVGTVDKVRGDRIILTKSDADAGGRHHSIPSRWLQTADASKVTLRKTAAEAKQHWRDEERSQGDRSALFGQDDGSERGDRPSNEGWTNLNRSFSGTY